ncbi:MAG: hypothetical protein ACXWZ6_01890 [Solirubrobacterales bacterium]
MKGSDRAVFFGVGVVLLAAAFYFLLLSPKRERAAELSQQVSGLEAGISEQEQVAAFGEQARRDFPEYYGRLVVLGKAVPEEADSASLLVQLNELAADARVDFRGITLGGDASGAGSSAPAATPAVPAAPPSGTVPTASGDSAAGSTETAAPAGSTDTPAPAGSTDAAAAAVSTTAAPATEATAAELPLGAIVGTAGLSTLPYELTFRGGFFDIAGYIGGVDSLVQVGGGAKTALVDGRLLTVDGFALKGGSPGGDPELSASFMLTAYVTPPTEGLTAGATQGGPAPAVPAAPQATPASTVTP